MATELEVKITADASSAERAVAAFAPKASKYLGGIGAELKSQLVGAFAAGAVISAVRSFGAHIVETVDDIKDLSDQLGISTDDVQRLQKAANDAGVGFSKISVAMQRIEALRAQAAGGDKTAQGYFSALGIDPMKGSGLDILTQAIDAGTIGGKSAAMFDLLGNKAALLKGVMSELKAQGPITLIEPGQIDEIDHANNRLKEIKRQATAQATGPAAGFLRYIGGALGGLTEGSVGSRIAGLHPLVMASRGIKSAFGGSTLPPMDPNTFIGPEQEKYRRQSLSAATPASISLGQQGDALSRIGHFVGGSPSVRGLNSIERNTADTARAVTRQTQLLKMIEEHTRDLD